MTNNKGQTNGMQSADEFVARIAELERENRRLAEEARGDCAHAHKIAVGADAEIAALRQKLAAAESLNAEWLRACRHLAKEIAGPGDVEGWLVNVNDVAEAMPEDIRAGGCGQSPMEMIGTLANDRDDARAIVCKQDDARLVALQMAENALGAATANLADRDACLSSVGCSTTAQLAQRYLDEMRRFNERDRPAGFDSWEAYHAHVVKVRTDNVALRAHAVLLHKTLDDLWSFCCDRGHLSPEDETEGVAEIVAALAATPEGLASELAELRKDKARLDWLEVRRVALNRHCGSSYGWKLVQSHLVNRLMLETPECGAIAGVDINDAEGTKDDVRAAIDAARKDAA